MQELAFDLGFTAWDLCELKGSFTFKALHSILSFLSFQWETQLKQRHGPLLRTLSNTPVRCYTPRFVIRRPRCSMQKSPSLVSFSAYSFCSISGKLFNLQSPNALEKPSHFNSIILYSILLIFYYYYFNALIVHLFLDIKYICHGTEPAF